MKILLLGCNGQLGWELQRSLAPLGEVIALGHHPAGNPQGLCGDLTQLEMLAHTVRSVAPHVIVNAAAFTAVDKAESTPELAHTVNALAPGILATEAQKLGAWLVHYSTDYVFDGSGSQPWREDDPTGPLSVYGRTKLDGERAVAQCQRHLLFRTSWVHSARGGNFARTMLRLAAQRTILQVIDDQWGAPTGADLLADVSAHAILRVLHPAGGQDAALAGLYHVTAAGVVNWFEYAKYVITLANSEPAAINLLAKEVIPIVSSAFPAAARRPLNSRLDCGRLQENFGLQLPHWTLGVKRMMKEIAHELST